MNIVLRIGAVAIPLAFLGCDGEAIGAAESPMVDGQQQFPDSLFEVDLATPDQALLSYWRLQDAGNEIEFPTDSASPGSRFVVKSRGAVRSMLSGDALTATEESWTPTPLPRFDRQIVDVELETETRAVIIARIRNVTPIPAGAEVTAAALAARREGEEFRYIFRKDATGWKLVQIQSRGLVYEDGELIWKDGEFVEEWQNTLTPGEVHVPLYVNP